MAKEKHAKNIYLHEILDLVAKAKSRQDKIDVLTKYNSLALRDFLRGCFDDTIQWDLPPGAPPYEELDTEKNKPALFQKVGPQYLKYFVKGGPGKNMMAPKRERRYIDVLGMLHPEDSKLFILMKDKDLAGKYKGLTKALVDKAFPGLIVK